MEIMCSLQASRLDHEMCYQRGVSSNSNHSNFRHAIHRIQLHAYELS